MDIAGRDIEGQYCLAAWLLAVAPGYPCCVLLPGYPFLTFFTHEVCILLEHDTFSLSTRLEEMMDDTIIERGRYRG